MCIQKGDLETGFAESDHVLEGEVRTGGQVSFGDRRINPPLKYVTM